MEGRGEPAGYGDGTGRGLVEGCGNFGFSSRKKKALVFLRYREWISALTKTVEGLLLVVGTCLIVVSSNGVYSEGFVSPPSFCRVQPYGVSRPNCLPLVVWDTGALETKVRRFH
ncbi:hypothetical protein MLD38_037934 [Melastoma candidum]|uniref:Uncharacterized protein n=1 Tax=Melastoma candidum TaxID=119954 RepID=A0ACB9KY75_9MYRT|nr:hypothetical protein MLD38_037934 [Melastoma candidum]